MANTDWCPFRPTSPQQEQLARDIAPVAEVQSLLLERHTGLLVADRVAHQYQIAGGKVELAIAQELPTELRGLGLFDPGRVHTGIGRISTGLGVPHLETNPDFLGAMLAFMTPSGQRVDLLGINDPTSPTDTHQDFVAVLRATAAAAGAEIPLLGDWGEYDVGNLLVEQKELVLELKRQLGLRQGLKTLKHLLKQTFRTFRSSTAYQPYWTGILEANERAGKFTLLPRTDENQSPGFRPGEHYLTDEWHARLTRGPIEFSLYWIPYLDEVRTNTVALTEPWQEDHKVEVASIRFMQNEDEEQAALWAILASEMGANPGHWIADSQEEIDSPGTEFTAARQLAYALSQRGRNVLPPESYSSIFVSGNIDAQLARELNDRVTRKQSQGHISWAQPE